MERQEIVLFLQELYKNTFLAQDAKMINGAIEMLQEDPVHAAGGVYCKECYWFDTQGYETTDPEMPELQMGYCAHWRKDPQACESGSRGG